jgi:hypothetical protein
MHASSCSDSSRRTPVTRRETTGERATALVRSYKRDLDRNRLALHEIRRELLSRGPRLTEVRILDMLIWSFALIALSLELQPLL